MPTEALKTLVIPVLNCAPFSYDICGNADTVTFTHKFPQFTSQWQVIDHPKSHVLSIEALNIVSFDSGASGICERACQYSDNSFGRFIPVPGYPENPPDLPEDLLRYLVLETHLTYVLELLYVDETTPAAFEHALRLALDTVGTQYRSWLRAAKESRLSEGEKEKGLFDRIKDAFD